MRRAAFGVAVEAMRMLAERGHVAGARVGLLVGAGNNGGDALWAGYELRRRGAHVTAVLLDPARAHQAGLAALRRAGGRVVEAADGEGALVAGDVGARWPVPGPSDDKYTQGVTGIAAGSSTYPGAAVLSAGAAVLATSGMVRYAGYAADVVRGRWPELVATGTVEDAGRVQAWVVGPGLG